MRILLVQDNGLNESLALTEASALLRRHGHERLLLLDREERDLARSVRRWKPDLVVLPGSILARRAALDLAGRVKAAWGAPLVLCGTLPTFRPEAACSPDVDWLCVGEADLALADLATALQSGGSTDRISNLWPVRQGVLDPGAPGPLRPLVPVLDDLPLPDREMYFRYRFLRDFPWKKFSAGRGCVHGCSYCYQPRLRGMYRDDPGYVRLKSPERVIREVQEVRRRAALAHVHFADDLFTIRPEWVAEVAGRLRREVGLPFSCNSSAELLSEAVARDLARGGCVAVALGVESGDEALRARILGKPVTDESLLLAARHVHEAGMRLVTFNMLASPGETLEQALATLRLNRRLGADAARVCFAFPIPGTRMFEDALAEGYLDRDTADGIRSERLTFRPRPILSSPDVERMRSLYAVFRLACLLPEGEGLARVLSRLPHGLLDPLLWLQSPLVEQRIFRLSWLQGLRFYRHTGPPERRTTNFTSLP